MKKKYLWMMAAILVCATSVLTSCSDTTDNPVTENDPLAEKRAQLQGTKRFRQVLYIKIRYHFFVWLISSRKGNYFFPNDKVFTPFFTQHI